MSLKMVCLMHDCSCKKSICFDSILVEISIQCLCFNVIWSCYNTGLSRIRKTPFRSCLLAACFKHFRIYKYKRLVSTFRYIYDDHTFKNTNLRCCKSDTIGIIHSLQHVIYKHLDSCRIFFNFICLFI